MTLLLPPGVLVRPGEAEDLSRRVRDGDQVVGWRGDDTMDVYIRDGQAAVYGNDRAGVRYLAAVVDISHSGWREELLRRLRDGDWRTSDPMERINKANAAVQKALQDKNREAVSELNEHLTWAAIRDNGHLSSLGTNKTNLLA